MLHGRMLRYLDEVVRSGSIRRAAVRLNVASSAINRQILDLEAELGVPLFERLPRRLRLTSAGEVLVAHVRRTLTDYRAIESRLGELKGLHGGAVTLATMNGLAGGIAPAAIAAFSERFPRIRVTMRVMFVPEILRVLAEGEADLGLGYHLPDTPGLRVALQHDGNLGAVVAPDHPLAAAGRVRLAACAVYPLILADPSMRMHQTVRDALLRAHVSAEAAYLSNSIEFMKVLAGSGRGVAFLSRFDTVGEVRTGRLVFVPLAEEATLVNPLRLVHRTRETPGAAAELLADCLAEAFGAVGVER
jgi:DNA-binding transcriptional LysR family regulator